MGDTVGDEAGQAMRASLSRVLNSRLLLCYMPHLHSPCKVLSCFISSFLSPFHTPILPPHSNRIQYIHLRCIFTKQDW